MRNTFGIFIELETDDYTEKRIFIVAILSLSVFPERTAAIGKEGLGIGGFCGYGFEGYEQNGVQFCA